ncbi:MAG: Ribosomal large subunit pseudouridine synthase C [Chlamydiae bacterium]|nr:Ribosomal large subunit pseudouridine synthase C [Chlamydiota bacterium]
MPNVLFYDNHLLVLDKPAGILTQPDGSSTPSLEEEGKQWIKEKFARPGNVFLEAAHRLDKPVSGIVLFARTSKALSRLNASQREKKWKKEYLAWVSGSLEKKEGTLTHYLVHGSFRAHLSHPEDPGAKKCLLSYRVTEEEKGRSLIHIELQTGRYHQIRAQLAAIGHPILGDLKYGGIDFPRLALHHFRLSFPHPTTQKILIFASPFGGS